MSLQNLSKKKKVVICNFPRFSGEIWMPYLWASAKTYYELHGTKKNDWEWYPCYADVYSSDYTEQIKDILTQAQPDIFAISLYVWNYTLAHRIAKWVKITFPKCIVISGGPHQYFKHNSGWFKEHWYLDASLPGESYGELCFKEILDNYNNGTVDWNQIADICYPLGKSKIVSTSKRRVIRADKKKYDFDWSALNTQLIELKKFVEYQQQHFPQSLLLSVIETTRGCPYGCTYCDWGGGTSTTVIQKSIECVKQDIDALINFDLTYLYIADANFGIFSERDVEIITYLAKRKHETRQLFKTGYGGFAKTENRLSYIRDILKVDVDNDLSLTKELKLSLQTLDDEVLDNIDRKNISLDKQLEIYQPLAKDKQLPLYVEMIMGLPGITLDKYYYELDVLGERGLSVQWFEWILLPEAPAYALAYRQKYGLETITKNRGWAVKEEDSDREVVVGGLGFSKDDYLQMLLSNSLYHLFVQGGYYKDSINWIRQTHNLGYGKIIKEIYEFYFLKNQKVLVSKLLERWEQILSDPKIPCTFVVGEEEIYAQWYFIMLVFSQPDEFGDHMIAWLAVRYNIPSDIVHRDKILTLTYKNINTNRFINWFTTVDFRKPYSNTTSIVTTINGLFRNYIRTGFILRGSKKLFGIIATDK